MTFRMKMSHTLLSFGGSIELFVISVPNFVVIEVEDDDDDDERE